MLYSGQEKDVIWHHNSPFGRSSWLCSYWFLGSYQDWLLGGHLYFLFCWWFI